MSISSISKYTELAKQVSNWPRYFFFKFWGNDSEASFWLKKSGAKIIVPFTMLRVFKEVFMQNGYNFQFVSKHLKSGATVLDIGANIGMFSTWIANHFPNQPIVAYEPLPGNVEYLRRNLLSPKSVFTNCVVAEKAVTGKRAESVTFFCNKEKPQSDSASAIQGFYNNYDSIEVPAISLSEIISQTANRIGLIKIDCEGSEYDILYNTPASDFAKVDTMIIETHDLDENENNFRGVCSFLEKTGFSYTSETVDHGLHLIWATHKK
ncbi:MAG TPA: FkbM family methyltransferase [Phnomibacter sp.]|nr:FkbM family methyltransferase [Phnomibacter sp.]